MRRLIVVGLYAERSCPVQLLCGLSWWSLLLALEFTDPTLQIDYCADKQYMKIGVDAHVG